MLASRTFTNSSTKKRKVEEYELVEAMSLSNKNRQTASVNDAYLKLIGEVLKDTNPFYYLCECAYQWAEIGGIELKTIYEKSRKGTEFEAVPFRVMSHYQWHNLGLDLKKSGFKKTFLQQKNFS